MESRGGDTAKDSTIDCPEQRGLRSLAIDWSPNEGWASPGSVDQP